MPKKKPRLTEGELHALIVKEAKYRLGCQDFEPDFTLHSLEPPGYSMAATGLAPPITGTHVLANWEVESARDVGSWKPECAAAFQEAVARARRTFDITWRSSF